MFQPQLGDAWSDLWVSIRPQVLTAAAVEAGIVPANATIMQGNLVLATTQTQIPNTVGATATTQGPVPAPATDWFKIGLYALAGYGFIRAIRG